MKKPKILIVDDQQSVAADMAEMLNAYNFDAQTANSPAECFDKIKRHLPDVLLLDIRLSPNGTEGFDICRSIKFSPKTQGILVVLDTTIDEIDCEEGLASGADAFVRMPVDFLALRRHLQTLLQARDSAYEVARLQSEKEVSRLQTEKEFSRLQAEKDLASILAHDLGHALQTPLSVVASLEKVEPPEMQTFLQPAKEDATLASKLIAEMRARGAGQRRVLPANPTELLRECRNLRSRTCSSSGVLLSLPEQTETLPVVKADRWGVIFCLVELVNNALREFEMCRRQGQPIDKPQIVLSAEKSPEGIVSLKVADNGRGVRDALKSQIFQKGISTRKEVGGTGLGLWSVRKRLSEFGGEIRVENNPPQGAVFVITLPPSQ